MKPLLVDSIAAAVDQVLDTVQGEIALGIPLGIGKPNTFVNTLYRRIARNPARRLLIVTALSLAKPAGRSELEQRFLGPLVERVFGDYPDLDYVLDLRAGTLPANVEVREFFMKTGDWLGNASAQRNFIATNYTFAARDMAAQGLNVIAQAVAVRGEGDAMRLSLSGNPDVSLELVEKLRAAGRPFLVVGVVNRQLPFMPNGAEVPADFFDLLVTDPAGTHALFAPPNARVGAADHAIGLHAASLVEDGGTLQIGIGSLGDAIAQALILRDRHPDEYRAILGSLCRDGLDGRLLGRFERGLYGCSEMFVNGFLRLMEAGIVRREVFADTQLQQLINDGRIDEVVTPATLGVLVESGRVHSPLTHADLHFLHQYGVLCADVRIDRDDLVRGPLRVPNDPRHPVCRERLAGQGFLGKRLLRGIVMTGGFFLGPRDFYERLRSMGDAELATIDMTRIDFINQLYARRPGEGDLKRAQRRKARFINTTMIVTLLGAACSDALESGQVVSGVGGQYNFVAMSHALPDARLLMLLRATHENRDGLKSSIVWSYGNVTIPRHLRDVVITEYGVADLRGQPDSEVVKRLVQVADSRFQDELVREAKAHGKLEADWQVPDRWRRNTPAALADTLHPWTAAGLLPDFPFGTDLTDDEVRIVRALKKVRHASEHPAELLPMLVRSLWDDRELPARYAQRLGLDDAHGLRDVVLKKLLANNL